VRYILETEIPVERTLRQWKTLWEKWDRNEDIDEIFAEADLETDGETLCEVQITMITR